MYALSYVSFMLDMYAMLSKVMYDILLLDEAMFRTCLLYVCVLCGLVVVLAERKLIVLSLCCR